MPRRKGIYSTHSIPNTGFAEDKEQTGDRLINRDGKANVSISGISRWKKFSIYHAMLDLKSWKFFLIIFTFYTLLNFVFAVLYMALGINHLKGIISDGSFSEDFLEAYFFSAQTLTTVGYGRVSPIGLPANIVASFEALIGIMTLAIITGLLYGRFTRPKAYLQFSETALIAPFRGGKALMFRLAPTKKNSISDLHVTVTLSMSVMEDGIMKNKFYPLPLSMDKIMSLALNWTVVHPIEDDSPLYGLSKEEIDKARTQFIVSVKGFDEGFSSMVVARTGYTWKDIKYGAKFNPMYKYFDTNNVTMLELDKIDDFEKVTFTENLNFKSQNLKFKIPRD